MKPYKALDIARWFLSRIDRDAGDSITHLKLQKLVYYAQGWALAILGRSLFDEELEAWTHGPVAPTVWREYRDSGWDAIPPPEKGAPNFPQDVSDLLDDVHQLYGNLSAKRLETMTHRERPWRETRGNLPPEVRCTKKISKDIMREFFSEEFEKTRV